MSRINDIRKSFNQDDCGPEDIHYLLDIIDVMLAYNLTEMIPPDICDKCQYVTPDTAFFDCPRPLDDCSEAAELFFEGALDVWYTQIQKETKDVPDTPSDTD